MGSCFLPLAIMNIPSKHPLTETLRSETCWPGFLFIVTVMFRTETLFPLNVTRVGIAEFMSWDT